MCQSSTARYVPSIESTRMENGLLPSFAFPGGYPLFYVTADDSALCPDCSNQSSVDYLDSSDRQWHIVGSGIHWEGDSIPCGHCGKDIESAYGPVDAD